MKNSLFVRTLLTTAISTLFAQAAMAGGFALQEQNASGAGTAYAGKSAAGEDASAAWFNPASMGRLKNQEVVLGLHLININAEFRSDGRSRDPSGSAANDGGNPSDPAFIPNFHYVRPLNDKMNFGFSVGTPFGLATNYNPGWVGRFQGIDSEIMTLDLNPSLSYRVDENLTVGAGVSAQYLKAKLSQAVQYPTAEGTATIKGDSWGYGYNVGALLQAGPNTRVGLAWRSEVEHDLEGTVNFAGNQAQSPAVRAATANSGLVSNITLPGNLSLSSVTRLDERWELLTDLTWTQWSKIQELNFQRVGAGADAQPIPASIFRWRNTLRYAVGFTRQMSEKTKIKFGAAFDETPVTSENRGVRLPDENRILLSAGSQYQLSPTCRVDIGATYFMARKAQINDDLDNRNQFGLVSGQYKANAVILSGQVSYRF